MIVQAMASAAVPMLGVAGMVSLAGVVPAGLRASLLLILPGFACIPSFGTAQCNGYSHCMHSIADL